MASGGDPSLAQILANMALASALNKSQDNADNRTAGSGSVIFSQQRQQQQQQQQYYPHPVPQQSYYTGCILPGGYNPQFPVIQYYPVGYVPPLSAPPSAINQQPLQHAGAIHVPPEPEPDATSQPQRASPNLGKPALPPRRKASQPQSLDHPPAGPSSGGPAPVVMAPANQPKPPVPVRLVNQGNSAPPPLPPSRRKLPPPIPPSRTSGSSPVPPPCKSTANNDGVAYPETWNPPDPYDPFSRIELSPDDPEYKKVEQNVRDTAQQTVNKIVKIERIENHKIWKLYAVHRDEMEKTNGSNMQNERLLWHGTCIDALNNIYAGGFNRSYCGKNATAFGQGVYFAAGFFYSAQQKFSPPDQNGNRYIFQARVLTGHFTDGDSNMIEPPERTKHVRYDSVTNDANNPEIFVVFKDTQSYPEYLVCFQ